MKKYKHEIINSLLSCKMLFVIVLMCGVVIRVLIMNRSFQYKSSTFNLYADCFAASGMMFVVSFIAAIPYSTIFCNEYNSGYIRFVLPKLGFKEYFKRKVISVSSAGAVSIGVSLVIIFSIILIVGRPYSIDDIYILEENIWYNVILNGGILAFFAVKLLLGSLYGVVWSIFGFAVSTWITNKYVTLIAPFAVNQILWIALQAYPDINPIRMFRADFAVTNWFVDSFMYVITYQFILLSVFLVFAYWGMKRRLKDV